jgi:tRNA (cytidine/uridine-2'-O-)-methyltransferase
MLHVVLYQPEIPDNAGNVGRTCVALGAKLWLVRPLGFRLDDHHLRRAGLDYWQHLDWEAVDDWPTLLERLAGHRLWLFSKRAARPYTDAEFAADDALVFGSESQGLPPSLLDGDSDHSLHIPMAAEARSLNLAVSVAVAAFEAKRQCDLTALSDASRTDFQIRPVENNASRTDFQIRPVENKDKSENPTCVQAK